MKERLIELVEKDYIRTDMPEFKAGDTLNVALKVKEGADLAATLASGAPTPNQIQVQSPAPSESRVRSSPLLLLCKRERFHRQSALHFPPPVWKGQMRPNSELFHTHSTTSHRFADTGSIPYRF